MNEGIIFFNIGQRHLARLVVSLHSLRRHCQLPATILNAGGDGGIVEQIAADARLAVDVRRIEVKQFRRHTAYCSKASLWRFSPYDHTLYLDSDTLIAGDPQPLLESVRPKRAPQIVVTKFSDWVNTGQLYSGRIRQWENIACEGIDVGQLVEDSLSVPHPAVNTGCLAWRRDAENPILVDWERLTSAGWRCSFTDEYALILLLRKYPHSLADDRYNRSFVYGKAPPEKTVVWHGHGGKHTRPEALPYWLPAYNKCVENNIGNIRSWSPAGDERLRQFLAENGRKF